MACPCYHLTASDLKKAVVESGINLDGFQLDDIEPGVPSAWVRAAVDSNYEAWLPAPTPPYSQDK